MYHINLVRSVNLMVANCFDDGLSISFSKVRVKVLSFSIFAKILLLFNNKVLCMMGAVIGLVLCNFYLHVQSMHQIFYFPRLCFSVPTLGLVVRYS